MSFLQVFITFSKPARLTCIKTIFFMITPPKTIYSDIHNSRSYDNKTNYQYYKSTDIFRSADDVPFPCFANLQRRFNLTLWRWRHCPGRPEALPTDMFTSMARFKNDLFKQITNSSKTAVCLWNSSSACGEVLLIENMHCTIAKDRFNVLPKYIINSYF